MKRLIATLAAVCLTVLALAAPAHAAFGINNFDVTFTNEDGTPAEAGSHPFAVTTSLGTNIDGKLIPEGWLRNLFLEQIPGLVGDTTAYPRCTTVEFLVLNEGVPSCSLSTQVGITAVSATNAGEWGTYPLYNVTPPPGVLLRLGFHIISQNVFVDVGLSSDSPHNAVAALRNTAQVLNIFGSKTQLWGNPSDSAHDELRGSCGFQSASLEPGDIVGFEFKPTGKSCPVAPVSKPFLTMPTDCSHPLTSSYEAVSWNDRDEDGKPDTDAGSRQTHDAAGDPAALFGCGKLRALFQPSITAKPTSRATSSPTGLDFSIDVKDEGLTSIDGFRHPDIKRIVATLPEGMTANPSIAEGLEVCSEAALGRETLTSAPGEGCPEAAKIGTLEVESPLVEEPVNGTLYQATPNANLADDSLIAFYVVFKNPKLGIIVKQPVKVQPDPETGQLITVADDIPQLPFSHFRLHFREGGTESASQPPALRQL